MSQNSYGLIFVSLFTLSVYGCTLPVNPAKTMSDEVSTNNQNPSVVERIEPVTRINSEEKKTLSRLANQLKDLHHLIDEAEFKANPDSRIRFDYKRLRYDLMLITDGIKAHIESPVYTPRSIDPIRGNYR